MEKLFKLAIMGEAEYKELAAAVRTSDQQFACGYREGFNAGKWHSAGGYSHTLPKLKEELRQAQNEVARYKAIGEIFERTA